jgi:hypothetical protein
MTTFHQLSKPLERLADGSVKWEAVCGLKLALRPHPDVRPGSVVQAADKRPNDQIECAGCFGSQEQGAPKQTNQLDGDEEPQQAPRRPPGEVDDPNFTQLGEDEVVEE